MYWSADERYYEEHVDSIQDDGRFVILYDVEDQETLKLLTEKWNVSGNSKKTASSSSANVEITSSGIMTRDADELGRPELSKMVDCFGKKNLNETRNSRI